MMTSQAPDGDSCKEDKDVAFIINKTNLTASEGTVTYTE